MNQINEQMATNTQVSWTDIATATHKEVVEKTQGKSSGVQTPNCIVKFVTSDNKETKKSLIKGGSIKPPNPQPTTITSSGINARDYYQPTYGNIDATQAVRMVKLGYSYLHGDCIDCAIRAFENAKPVLAQTGNLYFEAAALEGLGVAKLKSNQSEAIQHLQQAYKKYVAYGACGSASVVKAYLKKLNADIPNVSCK